MSVAPSSRPCAAPWAMNGSIGWHASPSSVARPFDQRGSGGRSNSAQMNVSSTAPTIACTCGCQPSNAASASATSPRSVHDSRVQASWSKIATKLTSRCCCTK